MKPPLQLLLRFQFRILKMLSTEVDQFPYCHPIVLTGGRRGVPSNMNFEDCIYIYFLFVDYDFLTITVCGFWSIRSVLNQIVHLYLICGNSYLAMIA